MITSKEANGLGGYVYTPPPKDNSVWDEARLKNWEMEQLKLREFLMEWNKWKQKTSLREKIYALGGAPIATSGSNFKDFVKDQHKNIITISKGFAKTAILFAVMYVAFLIAIPGFIAIIYSIIGMLVIWIMTVYDLD